MKTNRRVTATVSALALTALFSLGQAGAETVLYDDFSGDPNNHAWEGRKPQIGNPWFKGSGAAHKPGVDSTAAGGVADTGYGQAGGYLNMFHRFRELTAHETVIVKYSTVKSKGLPFGANGWSGVDLFRYPSTDQRIFTGAAWSNWQVELHNYGSAGTQPLSHRDDVADITLTYEYDTGNYTFTCVSPGRATETRSGTYQAKMPFDCILINIGSDQPGADMAFRKFQIDIVVDTKPQIEWTGAAPGADNLWGTAENWAGSQVPAAGSALRFGVPVKTFMENDIPADTLFDSLQFGVAGEDYAIEGNRFGVNGAVLLAADAQCEVNTGFILEADPVIQTMSGSALIFGNTVSGNSGFTKEGEGMILFDHDNAFTGTVKVNKGTVEVEGDQTAATGGWIIGQRGGDEKELCEVYFNPGSRILVEAGKRIQLGNPGGGGIGRILGADGEVVNHGTLLLGHDGKLYLKGMWEQNGPADIHSLWGWGASLVVEEGAVFTYANSAKIKIWSGNNNFGRGRVTLQGGTLVTNRGFEYHENWYDAAAGDPKPISPLLTFHDGTLVLTDDIPDLDDGYVYVILEGDATIDTAGHHTNFSITPQVGEEWIGNGPQEVLKEPGPGGLTKQGEGVLTIDSAPNYTGNTVVEGGTLRLAQPGLHDESTVEIAEGAKLDLRFQGIDAVGALIIHGIEYGPGVYGAADFPGILEGDGLLELAIQEPIDFVTWATFHGLSGDPEADFDEDGLSDGLEYALAGLNPTVPDGFPGRIVDRQLRFEKNPDAVANGDVVYSLEISENLLLWEDEIPEEIIHEDDDVISIVLPQDQAPDRIFVRLRVKILQPLPM